LRFQVARVRVLFVVLGGITYADTEGDCLVVEAVENIETAP
jgi:hypothetical protein